MKLILKYKGKEYLIPLSISDTSLSADQQAMLTGLFPEQTKEASSSSTKDKESAVLDAPVEDEGKYCIKLYNKTYDAVPRATVCEFLKILDINFSICDAIKSIIDFKEFYQSQLNISPKSLSDYPEFIERLEQLINGDISTILSSLSYLKGFIGDLENLLLIDNVQHKFYNGQILPGSGVGQIFLQIVQLLQVLHDHVNKSTPKNCISPVLTPPIAPIKLPKNRLTISYLYNQSNIFDGSMLGIPTYAHLTIRLEEIGGQELYISFCPDHDGNQPHNASCATMANVVVHKMLRLPGVNSRPGYLSRPEEDNAHYVHKAVMEIDVDDNSKFTEMWQKAALFCDEVAQRRILYNFYTKNCSWAVEEILKVMDPEKAYYPRNILFFHSPFIVNVHALNIRNALQAQSQGTSADSFNSTCQIFLSALFSMPILQLSENGATVLKIQNLIKNILIYDESKIKNEIRNIIDDLNRINARLIALSGKTEKTSADISSIHAAIMTLNQLIGDQDQATKNSLIL